MRQSFSKESRIASSKRFKQVLNLSNSFKTPFFKIFTLQIASNESTLDKRLGIIVAKQVFRHATVRNKAKRWVRESFRTHKHDITGLGIDIIIVVRELFLLKPKKARELLDSYWSKLSAYE